MPKKKKSTKTSKDEKKKRVESPERWPWPDPLEIRAVVKSPDLGMKEGGLVVKARGGGAATQGLNFRVSGD